MLAHPAFDRAARRLVSNMLLACEEDAPFPPADRVPVVLSQLATRFGVTHVHLRGLLRQAQAAGVLARIERGGVVWSATGQAMARGQFAAQLAELIAAGRAVLPSGAGTTPPAGLFESAN